MNKLMAMLLMAVMVFATACTECDHEPYDDSQLKQQIAELYSKIASLEAKLNADMTTLQAMIAGQVTVVAHTQDADGNWTIKLSDGTKFVVYASQQEMDLPTTLVYVMELNGEKVWATMGANGQLTPMLDNEGNVIPVIPVMEPAADPELETKVENGVIYIRIKGTDTWLKTGIASDATPSLETKVEKRLHLYPHCRYFDLDQDRYLGSSRGCNARTGNQDRGGCDLRAHQGYDRVDSDGYRG